jgi:hypothetical protein
MDQIQIQEVIKAARDPIYFAENYFQMINLECGKSTFKLYPKQKRVLDLIENNPVTIANVARQTGMSTIANIYALWETLFVPDRTVGIIVPKMATAKHTMERLKQAYEDLPNWMKPEMRVCNSRMIEFNNGSRIIISSTAGSFRGCSVNVLMLSDAAFYRDYEIDEIWYALCPIVSASTNGKIFVWSSPNGKNLFKKLYSYARSNRSKYKRWKGIEISWHDVPKRNEEWKKRMIECMGEKAFKSEMECKF